MAKYSRILVLTGTVLLYYVSSPASSQAQCSAGQYYTCLPGSASYSPCGGPDDGKIFTCHGTQQSVCIPGNRAVTSPPMEAILQESSICRVLPMGVRPANIVCTTVGTKFGMDISPNLPNSGINDFCRFYHHCIATRQPPIIEECPENQHFSVKAQKCMPPYTAGCSSGQATGLDCIGSNYFKLDQDESICTNYKICTHLKQRISLPCPIGQYYNIVERSCKPPPYICENRLNPENCGKDNNNNTTEGNKKCQEPKCCKECKCGESKFKNATLCEKSKCEETKCNEYKCGECGCGESCCNCKMFVRINTNPRLSGIYELLMQILLQSD